jgi:glycosyltransferase involved in cell wall biosynthesis
MIEAMACGLPCIGSAVGGIPELLPAADLVSPGDAQALADKIIEVLNDPERMRAMSARNLEKAKEYRKDILDLRRREFYRHLRNQTEAWLQARDARP